MTMQEYDNRISADCDNIGLSSATKLELDYA